MSRRVRALVGAVAVVSIGACSGPGTAPNSAAPAMAPVEAPGEGDATTTTTILMATTGGVQGVEALADDIPPEALRIPEPKGNNALIQRLGQTHDFCTGFARIAPLEEPRDRDFGELTQYADLYFNLLGTIDLERDIPDRKATKRGARMDVPDDIVAAIGVERQEMFSFSQRVRYGEELRRRNEITDEDFRRRVDVAFVKLATGPYAAADRLLVTFWESRC